MKRLCAITLFSFLLFHGAIVSASAQGRIFFNNRNLTHPQTGAIYDAGILASNFDQILGNNSEGGGSTISVGLFLASNPNQPLKFTDGSDAVTPLRATTGKEFFLRSAEVVVPGVPAGQRAPLLVRAWSTDSGSYVGARGVGGAQHGEQLFMSKPLGAEGSALPDIAPFNGFELRNTHFGPIGTFDFQLPPPGYPFSDGNPGTFYPGAPAWWRAHNPQNLNGTNATSDVVGVLNVTGTGHFTSGTTTGKVAFLHMNGPAAGEAGIEGFGRGVTLEFNRRYVLIYSVGNPASGTSSLGSLNLTGFPGYRVELRVGDTILASDNNTLAPALAEGTFATNKLEFITTDQYHPGIGRGLLVRLVNLNQPGTDDSPGVSVAFDKVRLLDMPLRPQLQIHQFPGAIQITWTDWGNDLILLTAPSAESTTWEKIINLQGYSYHYPGADNRFTFTASPTTAAFYRLISNE